MPSNDMQGALYEQQITHDSVASVYSSLFPFTVCMDCSYALEISITDPDGLPVPLQVSSSGNNTSTLKIQEIYNPSSNPDCTIPSGFAVGSISFSSDFTKVGAYTVTKILRVQEKDFTASAQSALSSEGISLDDLISAYNSDVDLTLCASDCESYADMSLTAYIFDNHGGLSPGDEGFMDVYDTHESIYEGYLNECNGALLGSDYQSIINGSAESNCLSMRLNMENHVSPNGFHYESPITDSFWQRVDAMLINGVVP